MDNDNSSDGITTLNTLIATTIDSVTGYEDSAKNIDNERLRQIFRERADERQRVAEDLRAEVRRLGGDVSLDVVPDAGHYLLIDPESHAWDHVLRAVESAAGLNS